MGIEEKLKTQSGIKNKTSGNLINEKRAEQVFHSNEYVGVIEVNWKGLFEDCKYAWMTVLIFMSCMLYGVWTLSVNGYFDSKKITEEITKVKILEVTNYFGKKILISGELTNHIPVEVRLPQKCVVDPRWIGSEIELKAEKYQNNHTKITNYKFTGVENLCDSTEGYLKTKKEKEKMKELVNKIANYEILSDQAEETKSENKIESSSIINNVTIENTEIKVK